MKSTPIQPGQAPIFREIAQKDLDALLHCLGGYVRSYEKGAFIILDQEEVPNVGVVLQGTVHMCKEDIWGNQTLLAYLSPGDLFGETFALQRAARSYVSFLAATDCQVLFLDTRHILHPCERSCLFHHRLTENIFDLLGKKNVQLMEKIEVTGKGSLREKILTYLSLEAQKQGSKYLVLPLSRTEMARFLSTNRSAMTRELSRMREEGIIDFDRNTFVLKK